ncbi:hypothetical protein JL475_23300 [Streptomyces sp. M2CJ-2]|uniref:hypothetical protein n=1 Tax=Streptomyces sp. M2CJ-2 TaxID=2803948 RepID=UPI001925B85F|nr:hypothetical protein [Streptomyces sp. M2CJ-2]MBL3668867.1 hypothetical protein [Streptomyces sp. M2CJ-2]
MQLSFLGLLFDRPGPWATVYFDAAQNDEAGAKRRELSVREACRTLEEEGADDALLRSAAVTAADVLIVPPPDEDGPDVPAGGLGALLRWTYEPTPA